MSDRRVSIVKFVCLDGCPSAYLFHLLTVFFSVFMALGRATNFKISARSCNYSTHGPLSMHGPCSPLWHQHV